MLIVVRTFGEELPAACQGTCQDYWAIFDLFLEKYASDYDIAERVTRVLRHGLVFFGNSAAPVATSVLARMSTSFEVTGFPSYLWIAGKIIGLFGEAGDTSLRNAFRQVYESSTAKVVTLLQNKSPEELPDGD